MLETAFQEPGNRGCAAIERDADFGQGATLPVVQDERLALIFGEPGDRVRQQDCLLVSLSDFAGRGLLSGQPVAEPGRRLFHLLFKRSFAGDVALLSALRRRASATLRARILRSHAACSSLVVPRNWSRFSKASMSVCCTMSEGSIRVVGRAPS